MAKVHGIDTGAKVVNDFGACALCYAQSSPEYHHILPVAFGGVDGPQIRLCADCHSSVHRVAISADYKGGVYSASSGVDLLTENEKWQCSRDPHTTRARAHWLVSVIVAGERSVQGNPNKITRKSLQLSGVEHTMVKELKAVIPGCKSQEDAIKFAIRLAHNQRFSKQ